ncbi:hypothetical protein BDV23DRAFT_152858 [Aspergillus alliaceus]|uniref:Uncharacterized protein n=1 Tax=Petromyces alliaceus TaxID=209559 RepID=A0A5N7CDC1_PETAA|nr:hypothetical protein BDV23DRAFT_152858 [Aspergillus alliaceus]
MIQSPLRKATPIVSKPNRCFASPFVVLAGYKAIAPSRRAQSVNMATVAASAFITTFPPIGAAALVTVTHFF